MKQEELNETVYKLLLNDPDYYDIKILPSDMTNKLERIAKKNKLETKDAWRYGVTTMRAQMTSKDFIEKQQRMLMSSVIKDQEFDLVKFMKGFSEYDEISFVITPLQAILVRMPDKDHILRTIKASYDLYGINPREDENSALLKDIQEQTIIINLHHTKNGVEETIKKGSRIHPNSIKLLSKISGLLKTSTGLIKPKKICKITITDHSNYVIQPNVKDSIELFEILNSEVIEEEPKYMDKHYVGKYLEVPTYYPSKRLN
jgi:hypothetical protein